MRVYIVILLSLGVLASGAAQKCTCLTDLQWLIQTFEANDAGFEYVLQRKGQQAYQRHKEVFLQRAAKITDKHQCLQLLNAWTEFFRKDHLEVVLNTHPTDADAPIDPKELFKDAPRYPMTEEALHAHLRRLGDHPGFEGIWATGGYTIAIVRDSTDVGREYVGFILNSANPLWDTNQVKLEIWRDSTGAYVMRYYMGDHRPRMLSDVELAGNNYLLTDFVAFKRMEPPMPGDPEIDRYYESTNAERPFLRKIDDSTLLLRIPSFRYAQKPSIDSVLQTNHALITHTKYLIIDLRNNGGGSDASYENLLPYLYTNPIRVVGVEFYSTELNNRRMVEFMRNPQMDERLRQWARAALDKLNRHLGEYVNLQDSTVDIVRFDTIYPYPAQVAVLINGGCGSTTEQFLLAARQSKKTKLYGTTTVGALDISNLYRVTSPCGDYTLWYGLTRSYRLPDFPIDGIGIQPDFFFDRSIKPYEWIRTAVEILHYQ